MEEQQHVCVAGGPTLPPAGAHRGPQVPPPAGLARPQGGRRTGSERRNVSRIAALVSPAWHGHELDRHIQVRLRYGLACRCRVVPAGLGPGPSSKTGAQRVGKRGLARLAVRPGIARNAFLLAPCAGLPRASQSPHPTPDPGLIHPRHVRS